jgi:hypothetical protein
MKQATKLERVSAAIAAVAVSLSIVWAISGYAYPEASASWLDLMAKKMLQPSRS